MAGGRRGWRWWSSWSAAARRVAAVDPIQKVATARAVARAVARAGDDGAPAVTRRCGRAECGGADGAMGARCHPQHGNQAPWGKWRFGPRRVSDHAVWVRQTAHGHRGCGYGCCESVDLCLRWAAVVGSADWPGRVRVGVGLVPLDPAGAGAAVVGPAGHHGPGEPAGAAVVVAQEHGSEGDRRHIEADLHGAEPASGFGSRRRCRCGPWMGSRGRPTSSVTVSAVAGSTSPRSGCWIYPKNTGHARDAHADVGQVDPGAVVEAHGAPAPSKGPPVPHAPGVVALALPVDVERLAADGDGAGDEAGDLVAGGQVVVVGDAVGGPGEVEVETAPRDRSARPTCRRPLAGR